MYYYNNSIVIFCLILCYSGCETRQRISRLIRRNPKITRDYSLPLSLESSNNPQRNAFYPNNPFLQNSNPTEPSPRISTYPPSNFITPGIRQPPQKLPQELVVVSNDLSLNRLCLKSRGQFPGKNCNSYVNCWDGVAIEQTCPESLVFNPKGFCDYAGNVNCNNKGQAPASEENAGISTTTQIPTNSPVIIVTNNLDKRCLRPRGQFPIDSCTKYVNCWDGIAIEQDCPEGLLFSSDKGYCDYSHYVKCQSKELPSTLVAAGIPDQVIPDGCPFEFGTFRDKDNCSLYFTCVAGKVAAKYSCPEGLSFNDNIGVCDWNDRVDCSKDRVNYYQPKRGVLSCPSEFGTFRDDNGGECRGYFTCISGKVVAQYKCPQGLKFSNKLGICDRSDKVQDCPSTLVDPQENFLNNVPLDAVQKLDKCTTGTVFRLNPQCTIAGICRDSLTEIIQCPRGLAYDSITDKCLPVFLAKC